MTESPPLGAGWAVWSKHPGTRDDYAVLDCSEGPLSKGEFAQLVAYFAPGSPSAEPGTPGSLPWVTLSRVGVGAELYLGISVQAGTEDKDFTGRPISTTSYFCVPYAELASSPVTYADMYAAVASPGLLADAGRGVIPLAIPALDPAALAQAVLHGFDPDAGAGTPAFGAEAVATTAAMLLDGPVTITGPNFPDLATRLRFFDAVAALLPYGYRAYLTAATWSDSGAGDRFRLVFADRARDEASRVRWGTAPRPAGGGPSQRYLDYLLQVVRRPGDGRLERLIAYLADDSAPRKFEEPAHAADSLHQFLLPLAVAKRIGTGDASLDDIRQLLRTSRVRELPVRSRTQALRKLIAGADAQDAVLITQWYDELAANDLATVFTDVVIACRRQVWAGSASLSREYLRFMSFRGRTDELLSRLVTRPDAGASQARGLDALSRLLTEFVVTSATGPDSFRATQRAVEGNPVVAAALLASLAASSNVGGWNVESTVAWLEPAADRVVQPFVSLLRGSFPGGGPAAEAVTASVIAELDHYGEHASVRYLLHAASYQHKLHTVLPGFATWLQALALERARADSDSRYWLEVAMELSPATMDEAAWLDLALLVTGNHPRALLAGPYSQPQFSRELARAWRELTATAGARAAGAAEGMLEDALIAFIGSVPWRASQAQTEAVLSLARALATDAERPRLMAVILNPADVLRQMPAGTTPDEIARACARAWKAGLSRRQAGEALLRSGAITSAEQAAAVIESLQPELAAAGAGAERYEWPLEFAAMFAKGAAGQPPVARFPAVAAVRLSEQMLFRIKLLDVVLSQSPPDTPVIDAALGKYLERNRGDLDDVIKEAAKRQSRGGRMGWLRGHGGNEGRPEETPAGEPGPGTVQAGRDPGGGAGGPGGRDSQGGPR